jgi:hypothetical protein
MNALRTAAVRLRARRLVGALLLSLGTAVFSGVVGLLVGAAVDGTAYHWTPIVILLLLGLALSGYGGWLVAGIRVDVALAIAAVSTADGVGSVDTYRNATASFLNHGSTIFAQQTVVHVEARTPEDLRTLQSSAIAGISALSQAAPDARRVGLFFQGRHHFGFHLGGWLGGYGKTIDLYAEGGSEGYFSAIRLARTPQGVRAQLDINLYLVSVGTFGPPKRVAVDEIQAALKDRSGTAMGLAMNLNGPVDDANLLSLLEKSAHAEGLSALIVVAPPRPEPGLGIQIPENREAFESCVSTIVGVAQSMPTSTGVLYFKTPACIAVALGHFLRGKGWTPMRHVRDGEPEYERFAASPLR